MKITKSFLKKIDRQANVEVNRDYYTQMELEKMVKSGVAFRLCDLKSFNFDSKTPRIDLDDVEKLDVIIDEDNRLTTIAVLHDGTKVYVIV